jgi:hypothetical protein
MAAVADKSQPQPSTITEPRWPSAIAVIVAIALYAALPDQIISGSHLTTVFRVGIPVIELALLIPLAVTAPHREAVESGRRRMAALMLIAVLSFANIIALGFLINVLLDPSAAVHGKDILLAGFQIWLTNVIAFGLWYWELDGGGPPARFREPSANRDFAFPQMSDPEISPAGWYPRFVDYLYVSWTNATAFSPTDTMPLTHWAKLLMVFQSGASILTLILVAARAVNILTS